MARMKPAVIRLHFEAAPEGGYTVTSPDLPDLVTEGETIEECIEMAEDAADTLYRSYVKAGDPLPTVFQGTARPEPTFEISVLVGRQWAA